MSGRGRPRGSHGARSYRSKRDQRRIYNTRRVIQSAFAARRYPVEDDIPQFNLGRMDQICEFCNALHFVHEKVGNGYSQCCQKGKVIMEGPRKLKPIPQALQGLYTGTDASSLNFQENIRKYNSAFSFASQKVSLRDPLPGHGPYTFSLHGSVYSRIGPLIPQEGNIPTYCQLYTLDIEEAKRQRMNQPPNVQCNPHLMETIDRVMRENNPFASAFMSMGEVLKEEREKATREGREMTDVRMVFTRMNNDQRRYNEPTGDNIAAIFVGENGEPPTNVDFTVYARNQPLQTISHLSPRMDPMVYPLLFPNGEQGWTLNIFHSNDRATAQRNKMTMLQYYAYRIAVREGFSAIHSSGKLFQQYLCCSYVVQEGNNLNWIRKNQPKLRTEKYQGLMDYVAQEAEHQALPPGRVVILPSSYKGSPRNMQQNYQDAMAVVRKYGKPDLFITFTCNPKWPEITKNIKPWEKAENRPDVTSRVFRAKLKEIQEDLIKRNLFGQVVAHIYVIEFQKRGLPHAHLLIVLKNEHKVREPQQIDEMVWAEIPNEKEFPRLYNSVIRHMIHGPCGTLNPNAVCMSNGCCVKQFPKDFKEETVVAVNGYPQYKRRETGTFLRNNLPIDNRWIVPYNPYLILKYDAHINVEICSTIKSVKYLYKYVYKGHDSAAIEIRQNNATTNENGEVSYDEIRTFLDSRYVSAPEAVWRLLCFDLDGSSHVIKQLAIHLDGQQYVTFEAGNEQATVDRQRNTDTTLTAFFKLNQQPNSGAQEYLYHEIPNHFIWENNKWKPRQRGGETVIARMYHVSPKDTERYFLRLLLLNVRGPTSYNDLKTVNNVLCSTYLDAAKARNLLHDNSEWSRCLDEASHIQHPKQLRFLFAIICIHAESLTNHLELYKQFEGYLTEDFTHDGLSLDNSRNAALLDIDSTLRMNGKTCENYGLPSVSTEIVQSDEVQYNRSEEAEEGRSLYQNLNTEQKIIVDGLIRAIETDSPVVVFMDGPGGTGKTYVYKTLLHILRGRGQLALAVAPTGIAATLLPHGQTVHSRFKFPVPFVETSVSFLSPNSPQADILKNASLIVWDEAPMSPSLHFTEVDRLLKEICCNNSLFGGKTILFGGDFRQTLPVVPRGTRSAIVNACLKRNRLWPQIKLAKLVQNMRADDSEQEFAEWLLKVGEDKIHIEGMESCIKIPEECLVTKDIETHIFGAALSPEDSSNYCNKVILCPTNENCLSLNNRIVEKFSGSCRRYLSIDRVECDDPEEQNNYPVEFLHSITPSGMPPHILNLIVGAVVILLRNLNTKKGLCNGTRMIVRALHDLFLDVKILTGPLAGQLAFIPRIDFAPSDTGLPFTLRRRQFPVSLAFAMTINKAQGQTFDRIGLYLDSPVFSHGQLYVAFSRVRRLCDIKVEITNTESQGRHIDGFVYTPNVVFHEVL